MIKQAIQFQATYLRRMVRQKQPLLFFVILLFSGLVDAADKTVTVATNTNSPGSFSQLLLGLGLVLGLILGLAWLLKRITGVTGTKSGLVRIKGGAHVGQRERVVVVEVGDTWLVLGVAPGHVNMLHSMPSGDAGTPTDTQPAEQSFAAKLRRFTIKQKND